jgi:hemolysin D
MSDPATLLLLTCANCLDTPADAVAAKAKAVAVQTQDDPNAIAVEPDSAVVPPEAMTEDRETDNNSYYVQHHNSYYVQHNSRYDKLALGSQGESVRQLQLILQELGHYSGEVDGIYGNFTKAAVLQFQASAGLSADGVVGDRTWEKLVDPRKSDDQSSVISRQSSVSNDQLPITASSPSPSSSPNSPIQNSEFTIENSSPSPIAPPESEQQPELTAVAASPTPNQQPTAIRDSELQTTSLIGLVVVLASGVTAVVLLKRYGKLGQWQLQLQTGIAALENAASGLPDSGDFDRPVMLQQSPTLPKAIAWTIVGIAVFVVVWASVAKIEQVVPASGELRPQGTVKEIQAPVSGVVAQVHVVDGDRVDAGDLLVSFDPTTAKAQLESLQKIRNALIAETNFYRTLMTPTVEADVERQIPQLDLPPEALLLAKSRIALTAQNKLYRTLLVGGEANASLDPDERAWLAIAKQEFSSRAATAGLSIAQLEQQLRQNQAQVADARARLTTDQAILQRLRDRNRKALTNASQSLEIEEQILSRIEPLVKEGAVARVQYDRQRQEVTKRSGDVLEESTQGRIQLSRQVQEVNSRNAEIAQLTAEQRRLQFDIAQAQAELNNTTSLAQKDVLDKIATNKNQIAEIDSQLSKIILENQKKIAEMGSQISQAELTLNYQELRAPVAGTVFDLKANNPGFVAQPSEALVKIVPDDNLVAEVYITNKDIGFVREDMSADIRIESFPFSEFGQIKGEVISIGSDSLPPDEEHPYRRFPAKVKLEAQTLKVDGREISLQSGMSVDVNIKVREDRRVINLLTELFTKKVESLEEVR